MTSFSGIRKPHGWNLVNFGFITRNLPSLRWRRQPFEERRLLGIRGERAAVRYLKRQHHRIIARNYRCPLGEFDVITSDGDTIVFVEVKTRSSDEAADLHEAVRPGKWRRVLRTARYYLAERPTVDRPCRFDLVTVMWPRHGPPRIEHFVDAFQP